MSRQAASVPVGSVTTWLSGGTPDRANAAYWAGSVPWISAATLKATRIYDSDQRITESAVRAGSKLAPQGATLVLVRGMALHHEVRAGLAMRPVSFNQDVKALIPRPSLMPQFLTYSLHAQRDSILDLVSSAGSGTGVLDTGLLKRLSIWLPEPHEQERIVDAIEDADSAVEALQRIIAKKQAIKQGMMQQLLTGKTRLPGFTEPWSRRTIDDLARVVSGGTPKSSTPSYWNGGVAWCTPTDITSEAGRFLRQTERTISQEGLEHSAAQLLPVGSLLLCTRATIGEVKISTTPIATNQGFKSLVPRTRISAAYLYYKVLNMKEELAAKGTGSTFLEVSRRDVASLAFQVPGYDEQFAIAESLSDVDDEIELLQCGLTKARSIKTGMMQQLLTGRVRLPVEAVS